MTALPEPLPAFTGWERGTRRRYIDKRGWHDPHWCLARVKPCHRWAELDTLLRRIVGDQLGPLDLTTRYHFLPARYVPLIADAFATLGLAEQLELRRLPQAVGPYQAPLPTRRAGGTPRPRRRPTSKETS